ncbi:BCD family MFS transporter [Pseudoxanthobacter sp. M-2]|uniref:BCD family MFS transporter n=1 Tax=Pseudoxanthobacter sp. M-2 TaxID=3078754 RepID=UPI0038FCE2E8
MSGATLGWIGIVRLGLVQTSLGAIVVLTTSTLNRVMVVELALPAMLPGILVGLHYGLQMLRPRWGYGSDQSRRRTPWIIAGMAVLAFGGALAAVATALMGTALAAGIALAVVAFLLIGIGVGASGTSLLVMLAERVETGRRAAAATIVWIMMIAGFAITATTAGHFLDPFTPARLVAVTGTVSLIAFVVTVLALWRVEASLAAAPRAAAPKAPAEPFLRTLAAVWSEPQARAFTIFIFVSMLAYSAQDLVLEPFAGTVFAMTPGESTRLGGLQNGGVLAGMILVAIVGTTRLGRSETLLRGFIVVGCLGSAAALSALSLGGAAGEGFPLQETVFALGFCNGVFAVAAIGSMMALAGSGSGGRQGTRMGLWGAAQAVAFGLGGFLGTVAVDLARHLVGSPAIAYGAVFAVEAGLFVVAAGLAVRVALKSEAVASRRYRPAPASGLVAEFEGEMSR